MILSNAVEAHKYFWSPRVEATKLITTSHDRFLQKLLAILHTNKSNVTLMAYQGFFAMLSQWNAS